MESSVYLLAWRRARAVEISLIRSRSRLTLLGVRWSLIQGGGDDCVLFFCYGKHHRVPCVLFVLAPRRLSRGLFKHEQHTPWRNDPKPSSWQMEGTTGRLDLELELGTVRSLLICCARGLGRCLNCFGRLFECVRTRRSKRDSTVDLLTLKGVCLAQTLPPNCNWIHPITVMAHIA